MVARNLVSCARVNKGYKTFYYDDAGIDRILEVAASASGSHNIRQAADAMRGVPVARADMARLALLWLVGGWWLDADVVCLDAIDETPLAVAPPACVFAWEGAVVSEPSSPLNWAFACSPKHDMPLLALGEAARRVLAFVQEGAFADRCRGERRPFCAEGETPVLELTGPAMLGDALLAYAQTSDRRRPASLRAVREMAGERAEDPSTWDSVVGIGDECRVTILPYCFFRSRGCAHLLPRWCVRAIKIEQNQGRFRRNDRVLFHHEFDTSWRATFFHNYHPGDDESVAHRRHARRTAWSPPLHDDL